MQNLFVRGKRLRKRIDTIDERPNPRRLSARSWTSSYSLPGNEQEMPLETGGLQMLDYGDDRRVDCLG